MTLCLVYVQNPLDVAVQRRIDGFQPLGHILMYGALADSKLLCGGTDRGPVLYDVKS